MTPDRERLERLLGGSDLSQLRRRLRARYERGETRDEFTLTELSVAERRSLEGLLGRAIRSAGSMRICQSELDEVIARAGLAADLRSALELLDGPIENLKAARITREQAWSVALERVDEPRLRALIGDATGAALLKRFSGGDAVRAEILLAQVRNVLARLPAQGVPLAQLAAEVLGESHALDAGRPVATLVLRTFAADGALEQDERVRDQWARLGVTVNELARPALFLNLLVPDGEPDYRSLRRLLRRPPAWDVDGRDVWACENPSIVTIAADRLGASCAPLLCTDGMPAAAQRTLLAQIVGRGGHLHYHGDFDWPGLGIGNFIMRSFGAKPWRFGAKDYLAALDSSVDGAAGRKKLQSAFVAANWDMKLAPQMAERGYAIHEEAVADVLLQDLLRGSA